MAGLVFDGVTLNGLVEEIAWGEWAADEQEAHCFGVIGSSSIEGAIRSREFSVPIKISGYGTQLLRDAAVATWEQMATRMGALTITTGAGTIFTQNANIKLLGVLRERSGYDGMHQHWRQLRIRFRQLGLNKNT